MAKTKETATEPLNIYQAIPLIQAAIGAVSKDKKMGSGDKGWTYRGIDDIQKAAHQPMIDYGVFFVPKVLEAQHLQVKFGSSGNTWNHTFLRVEFTFFAHDGSSIVAVTEGEGLDNGDKSSNKAMTAALKYALLHTFNIPTALDEDPDSEDPQTEAARQKPERTVEPTLPPKPTTSVKMVMNEANAQRLRDMLGQQAQKMKAEGTIKMMKEVPAKLSEHFGVDIKVASDIPLSILEEAYKFVMEPNNWK